MHNPFLCERLALKYNSFALAGHGICCIPVLLTMQSQESVCPKIFFFGGGGF